MRGSKFVLLGDTEGSKPATNRIAELPRLFYQRHLAQDTITCMLAAVAAGSGKNMYAHA